MSDKRKRELKRQQKKKEEAKRQQRLDRITPDVRESDIECWLVDEWEKEGWYDLHCLRRLPSGRWIIGVIGVNDGLPATGESDLIKDADPTGFHNTFIPDLKEKYDTRKVTLKEARDLVCGAIEWTKKHGFEVSANFMEGAAVVGSLAESLPDYQGFANTFDGTLEDLRHTMAPGQTLASMLRRADVDYQLIHVEKPEDFANAAPEDRAAQSVATYWKKHPAITLTEADDIKATALTYARAACSCGAIEAANPEALKAEPDERKRIENYGRSVSKWLQLIVETIDPNRAEALIDSAVKQMPVAMRESAGA
jgi:hypothetical protein